MLCHIKLCDHIALKESGWLALFCSQLIILFKLWNWVVVGSVNKRQVVIKNSETQTDLLHGRWWQRRLVCEKSLREVILDPRSEVFLSQSLLLFFASGGMFSRKSRNWVGIKSELSVYWWCQEGIVVAGMMMPYKVFSYVDVRLQGCYFSIFLQIEIRVGKLRRYMVASVHG